MLDFYSMIDPAASRIHKKGLTVARFQQPFEGVTRLLLENLSLSISFFLMDYCGRLTFVPRALGSPARIWASIHKSWRV